MTAVDTLGSWLGHDEFAAFCSMMVGSWPAVVCCHVRSGQVPIRRMAGMTEPDFMSDTKITSKSLKHLN